MDASVLAALQRWPNVPAVYGWLSLDARGTWRLHPLGDGLKGSPGESISSAQIIAFINRNYDHDERGNWFFQNGPQRVYVRLDAAPFILRRAGESDGFETHTGLPVKNVTQWLLDDQGRLFASTEHGAALTDSRELASILESLRTPDGKALIDLLEQPPTDAVSVAPADGSLPSAPLAHIASTQIPARMDFVACPANPGADTQH
nr:DUF2946 family protein [Pseudomonas sp.]